MLYAIAWMNLEDIILSEISQSQNDKYDMIPLLWSIFSGQIHGNRKLNGGCQELGGRMNGELFNGYRVSAVQDEKVLKIGCTTIWICLTVFNYIIHLKIVKMMNFVCVYHDLKRRVSRLRYISEILVKLQP